LAILESNTMRMMALMLRKMVLLVVLQRRPCQSPAWNQKCPAITKVRIGARSAREKCAILILKMSCDFGSVGGGSFYYTSCCVTTEGLSPHARELIYYLALLLTFLRILKTNRTTIM